MRQTEILFSIPGRIRLKIPGLDINEKMAGGICGAVEDMHGVISVRFNARTGSMLVCYRTEQVNESKVLNLIRDFEYDPGRAGRPAYLFMKKVPVLRILAGKWHPPAAQRHTQHQPQRHTQHQTQHQENGLLRRYVKAVLILGGVMFLLKLMIRRLIAMLIFACPAVLIAAPAAAFYYGMKRSGRRGIYMEDFHSLDRLRNTESVYIGDSALIKGSRREITDFVFGIRDNGITDIAAVTGRDSQNIAETASALGIEKIYRLKDNVTMLDFFHQRTLIVTAEELDHWIPDANSHLPTGLVFYVYGHGGKEIGHWDISADMSDIDKFPWLIGLSRYCKEAAVRSQNSAVAVNFLGILLASLGLLSPIGALTAYGINTACQLLLIKNSVLSYQKDEIT